MTPSLEAAERNAALLGWYGEHRRRLPWRDVDDPYATLVSEAMLQQTQVSRVVDRYTAFIERWPDPGSLAGASEVEVLSEWSGLGYNARAIRLRDAARIIARDGWPTSIDGLRALPGVGPYTAAAIASIAFGVTVPAVDTNLRRVLSRWVGRPLTGTHLDETAIELVPDDAGDWNQALMDLGSTVCRPVNPLCDLCPVSVWCADPTVYEPPQRQSEFDGSRRQLRGAIVRASVHGDDIREAGRALGRSDGEVEGVIDELRKEGLLPR